jgi:hypothetical protein
MDLFMNELNEEELTKFHGLQEYNVVSDHHVEDVYKWRM